MLALENTGRGFFLLPPVVGSRLSIDAGCDADLPGAPPWLPPGSSPHPSWWAYSPPATCLRWVRRCGRGARSAPCSWPPRMPMAGAPTDLVVDAPPRTPCACSPLQSGGGPAVAPLTFIDCSGPGGGRPHRLLCAGCSGTATPKGAVQRLVGSRCGDGPCSGDSPGLGFGGGAGLPLNPAIVQ